MRYRNATFLFNLNKRRIFRKPTLNGLYTPFGSPVSGQKPSLPLKKGVLKSSRPSFFDKASCTRQFESKLSLHSLASLFPIKEGSTFLSKPLFNSLYDPFGSPYRGQKPSGTRGCNRPTVLNFLPLRSKVGGPKRSSPYFAGWDRRGWEVYNLQFIVYC